MKLVEEDIKKFMEDQRSDAYRETIWYTLKDFVGRELNKDEVKKYTRNRYKNPNSFNLCLSLFKSFCKWKLGHLPSPTTLEELLAKDKIRDELGLITKIKREIIVKKIEKRALTPEELDRVLKVYPADSLQYAVLYLLAYTGARAGELIGIEPRMIKHDVVILTTEKTKVQREVPLVDEAARCLKIFLDRRPSYAYVYLVCQKVGKRLKIKLSPKTFRSTFRTLMDHRLAKLGVRPIRGDILIKLAQGHTTADMAGIYGDYSGDLRRLFTEWHFLP